jgi:two-component system, OmpR family, sensor histidine kinase KdpD
MRIAGRDGPSGPAADQRAVNQQHPGSHASFVSAVDGGKRQRDGRHDHVAETGALRTYLGTAPGVGKTYRMLAEGRDRAASGERVVIGWLETHGRAQTGRQAEGLEVVEPQLVEYRGSLFPEFDPAAAIASGADVVLVDELAHMSPDRGRQRWEDVADVLAAGLDVVTTANVAHLRSVRDYAAQITGVGTVASVPDEFVRSGDVVLVDMPADALRRRIAAGSVYSAEQVGGALADYFRAANLAALSQLGRAWMEGTAEDSGAELVARLGLPGLAGPAVPPVVLAADSGSASGETLIRRAAEVAREADAQLVVVHVRITDGLTRRRPADDLNRHRKLTAELGGTYIQAQGPTLEEGIAQAARAQDAAIVVVGARQSRLAELFLGSVSGRLRRILPQADVQEVPT